MESLWSHNCEYFALKGRVRIKVLDVYDGDTITAVAAVPCAHTNTVPLYAKFRFRLLGINTPELHRNTMAEGIAARNRLAQLLLRADAPIAEKGRLKNLFNDGETSHFAWAECPMDRTDKYGRVLARVFLDDAYTLCANDILVNESHAVPYMAAPF